MEEPSNSIDYARERAAVKTTYAADILKRTADVAKDLQKLKAKVDRYVGQAQLILTWKRGSGVVKMVGSAAKTIGGVMVVAAPLHPKLRMAVGAAQRLWKLGSGLKALNAVANMLRDFWQDGCRTALVEFTHCAAVFSQNIGVFQEVVHDLQSTVQNSTNSCFQTPHELFSVLREFIPPDQLGFAVHVINIAFRDQHYSPLFDFMGLSADPDNQSNLLQIMREVESFGFTEFAEGSDSKSLVAIFSFLHVARELVDFLDGFKRVTDNDCRFLQECLSKFTQESVNIMKCVVLLNNLYKIKGPSQVNSVNNIQPDQKLPTPQTVMTDKANGPFVEKPSDDINGNLSDTQSGVVEQSMEGVEVVDDQVVKQSLIVDSSRRYIATALTGLSNFVYKGSSVVRQAVRLRRGYGEKDEMNSDTGCDQLSTGAFVDDPKSNRL